MARRILLYGEFPPQVAATLMQEFSAHIVINTPTIDQAMAQAMQTAQYEAAVILNTAPKADLVAKAVGQRPDKPRVVKITAGLSAQATVDQITEAMGWAASLNTVFVVVTALKGGVGKSTLTAVMAHLLSAEHKVLAVDDNATQGNMIRFFHQDPYDQMPVSVIKSQDPAQIKSYAIPVKQGLDVLPPEDYTSTGGLTLAAAQGFWRTVAGMGYDLVLVDTTPSFATPKAGGEFVEAPLTYALIKQHTLASIFLTPFTPDDWGIQGLESSRNLLAPHNHADQMIAVVTATDAMHVLENVPEWVVALRDQGRFFQVPHNRHLRDAPHVSSLEPKFLRNPVKPYVPIAQRVSDMANELRRAGL